MTEPRPLSVLIVEDNIDSAETLAVLVEMFGHSARITHSGDEALRLAKESPPDVVLLDVGLPVIDGCALAEKLIAELPVKPLLVALTGYTHLREKCLAAGVDHYFIKPLEASVLKSLLRQYAERSAKQESEK